VSSVCLPTSPLPSLRVIRLDDAEVPLLQRFFDANPAYFVAVQGEPAQPNEAHEEVHGALPADFSYSEKLVIGYQQRDGELAAMATVVTDLLAAHVWHIGLFIVASARHGNGDARRLHDGLEQWARDHGAHWLRLGVVQGNVRAERFWAACGYTQVRLREGLVMGQRTNTVRVMLKPLAGDTVDEYLAQVPRDRPASPEAPMSDPQPRVGVGVFVLRDGLVLLGQRRGSHGAGTWALPGGHLEFGETVERCALREIHEETGLTVNVVARGPYTNDVFEDAGKHYVTVFVLAQAPHGEPELREPAKCTEWRWCRWSDLPTPLFAPLAALHASGYVPDGAE
jgi:ADP-ribose pyrophosphatase YjhB (NUDIX family)/GNAT superfamily N-acetyltransferase